MSETWVDYSFAHPSPAALKAAGVTGVLRYTTGGIKALGTLEASLLRAQGLLIGLIHETDPGRVNTGGRAGGAADAQQVHTFGDSIGYPADAVVFYADDQAPDEAGATDYFTGVRTIPTRRPVGWYGGMGVGLTLKARGLVDVICVANASSWSGFGTNFAALAVAARANPAVSTLQHLDKPLAGIDPSSYDYDEVMRPFPAWGRGIKPPAPPKPIPPVVRIPGVTVDFTSLPLDSRGNGQVACPGIDPNRVKAVTIVGLHDPSDKPMGYVRIPRYALDTHQGSAEVVLEDGVPGGRYVVRVATG